VVVAVGAGILMLAVVGFVSSEREVEGRGDGVARDVVDAAGARMEIGSGTCEGSEGVMRAVGSAAAEVRVAMVKEKNVNLIHRKRGSIALRVEIFE
jgi:hypothetical protein